MKLKPALRFDDTITFILGKTNKFIAGMSSPPIYLTDANIAYRVLFLLSVFYGIESISLDK